MKIHRPTKRLLTDDYHDAYKLYRQLSGGKAEPMETLDWSAWDIYPFEPPTYDRATHKETDTPIETVPGSGAYTWRVVAKSAEELSEELASHIARMDAACRAHIDKHAHWTGGIKALTKAQQGKSKALAMFGWAEGIWDLFWDRKEALLAGTLVWDESLLEFPEPQYTMREVSAE